MPEFTRDEGLIMELSFAVLTAALARWLPPGNGHTKNQIGIAIGRSHIDSGI